MGWLVLIDQAIYYWGTCCGVEIISNAVVHSFFGICTADLFSIFLFLHCSFCIWKKFKIIMPLLQQPNHAQVQAQMFLFFEHPLMFCRRMTLLKFAGELNLPQANRFFYMITLLASKMFVKWFIHKKMALRLIEETYMPSVKAPGTLTMFKTVKKKKNFIFIVKFCERFFFTFRSA